MAIVDLLLPEFDHEMGVTRRLLERVPDGRFDWKPHAKSMSLGGLATHVAQIPYWGRVIFEQDGFDMGADDAQAPMAATRAELLARFDSHVADTRQRLAGKGDAEMMAPWTFRKQGRVVFTMPRVAAARSFLLNHSIHHRGQLSVYLRLNDVPVPPIYGPSADEG
jgi:uncharacterized damage-inducible protein DinB